MARQLPKASEAKRDLSHEVMDTLRHLVPSSVPNKALLRAAINVIDLVRKRDADAARAYSEANVVLVRDRMVALRIRYTKKAAWAIGLMVAHRWMKMNNGVQPRKQNHIKTSGVGVHCLAEYPEWFKPEIDSIINSYQSLKDSQMDLWGEIDG